MRCKLKWVEGVTTRLQPHAFELMSQKKKKNNRCHTLLDFFNSLEYFVCHGWTLLSIYNLRATPPPPPSSSLQGLARHPGHAQQFICSLITDDTGWRSGQCWFSYQHTTSLTSCQARGRKIDRWTYYNDEQWKWKDRMQREEERLYVLLWNTWIIMLYMVIQHAYSYLISTILMSSSAKCKSAKNKKIGWAALTSLNSWIWACSNMENTLELAPSALLFLAFLGAFWHKERRVDADSIHQFK